MTEQKLSIKCDLCGRSDEDMSLLSANHKEKGWIRVCQECWSELYSDNRMVSGSSGSGKGSGSSCSSCPGCCR